MALGKEFPCFKEIIITEVGKSVRMRFEMRGFSCILIQRSIRILSPPCAGEKPRISAIFFSKYTPSSGLSFSRPFISISDIKGPLFEPRQKKRAREPLEEGKVGLARAYSIQDTRLRVEDFVAFILFYMGARCGVGDFTGGSRIRTTLLLILPSFL